MTRHQADPPAPAQPPAEWEAALNAAAVCTWSWDVRTGKMFASSYMAELFSVDPQSMRGGARKIFAERIHPEDQPDAAAAFDRAIRDKTDFEAEYRVLRHGGGIRWIMARGKLEYGTDGEPVRMLGALVDITERKQAALQLEDARRRLNTALGAASVGTWVWEVQAQRVYADAQFARLFDVEAETAIDARASDFRGAVHPGDQPQVWAAVEQAIRERTDFEAEYRLLDQDGAARWVVSRGKIEYDARGEPVRMAGAVMDITDRKRSEDSLRLLARAGETLNSSLDLGTTLNNVASLVVEGLADFCLFDLIGEDDYVKRFALARSERVDFSEIPTPDPVALKDFAGRPAAKILLEGQTEFVPRVDDAWMRHWSTTAQGYAQMRDAGLRSVIVVPVKAGARILGGLGLCLVGAGPRHFTEADRELAEELGRRAGTAIQNASLHQKLQRSATRLQAEQQWLESILNRLPAPFLFIESGTGRVVFANRAADEIAGGEFPRYQSVAEPNNIWQLTDNRGEKLADDELPAARVARGERLNGLEVDWHLPSGVRPLLVWGDTIPAMHDHDAICVLMFQDIDRIRQVEDALREAGRQKDDFLATLAHELRNPLAPLRNAVEIMRLGNGSEATMARAREMMDRQLAQLVRLVDDLLDISRIGRGKIELRRERIELGAVITDAVEAAQPVIAAHAHQLVVEPAVEALYLDADRTRLAQVFANLLTNAAKFTPRGGHLRLGAVRERDEAVISVRDDGVGIAADRLSHIFDMFVQGDEATSRARTGLGIGLTLVKRLTELHGGSVEVRSEGADQGSEFIVRLPLATAADGAPAAAPDAPEADVDAAGRRVLVVDDNRDVADSLRMVLDMLGAQVSTAYSGGEALRIAQEFDPDVILLDIGMPDMSGYELARHLREQPSGRDALLVALTGFDGPQERRRAAEAGFDLHLVKPIEAAALEKLLTDEDGPGDALGSA